MAGGGRGLAAPGVAPAAAAGPGGRALTAEERAGEAIYRRENCARCHTLFDAPPAAGPVALPRPWSPSRLDARVGPDLGLEGHRRSDDWHYAHLYAPDVVVPGSRMPPSRHLFRPGPEGRPEPTAEGRSLVAWMQTLGRQRRDVWAEARGREPEIPAPERRPDAERLARGRRSYSRRCAACHGDAGDGRGPAAALLSRAPRDFTAADYRFRSTAQDGPPRDADLFRAITLGTGAGAAMPGFLHLDPEERWDLVRRIREFAPGLRGRAIEFAAADPAGQAGDGSPAGATGALPAADPAAEPAADDLAAAGAALYAELGCASCHGPDAGGRPAPAGDGAWVDRAGLPIPRSGDLRHPCGLRSGASEEALARALEQGVGTVMPSYALALEGRPGAARALGAWLRSLDPEAARAGATAP